MNVQSLSCQPLKPSYQYMSTPSFGRNSKADEDVIDVNIDAEDDFDLSPVYEDDYDEADFSGLRKEKSNFEEMAKNKDSKLISSMGTLGAGLAAGALSFFTFKTMAPKGAIFAKTVYNKIAGLGIVQKTAELVKKGYNKLTGSISKGINKISPESKVGKAISVISEKYANVKSDVIKATNKISNPIKEFATKHNINKEFGKKAINNTGAALVAIPAATTAINASLESKEGGEDYDE